MSGDMNLLVERQFQELINSIKSGHLDAVQTALRLSNSEIVNKIQPQFRQPPLYFAAIASGDDNSAQLIKLLLRYGANAKFKDHNQQTVLFYICRQGKQKCAEILLSHGLSLDEVDIYGQTPMFYAVSQNKIEIVRKYATKQRLNHVDKLVAQTPLYYAARKGHLQMCKLLVDKGVNIEHVDSTNKTAAQYAKKAKYIETAQFLNNQIRKLKEGVDKISSQETRKKEQNSKDGKQSYKIVLLNDKGQPYDLTQQDVAKLTEQYPQLKEYLTNPDSITEEQLKSVEGQTWQKIALKVHTVCSKQKGSFYFQQPVDPIKFNIHDYFDIVQNPMDLGTVKKRLLHNYYATAWQFVSDMQLIWQNSYRYNGDSHIVSKCGKQIESVFRQSLVNLGLARYLRQN